MIWAITRATAFSVYSDATFKVLSDEVLSFVATDDVESDESDFPEQPANNVAVIASVRNAHRFFVRALSIKVCKF